MIEIQGNLWDYYITHGWLMVTTNGDVNSKGRAVMGRGVAYQAASRFPDLSKDLAYFLRDVGNIPVILHKYLMMTLPVKHHWHELADIQLIRNSCNYLVGRLADTNIEKIYMPRPGCGNGGLIWEKVKPEIETILDNRFVVVEIGK